MVLNIARVQRELSEIMSPKEIKETGIKIYVEDGDLGLLHGEIRGPADSTYGDGVFHISITVSQGYPFKPPVMRFTTKVWHPNVSCATGEICQDVLKEQWAPSMTLWSCLLWIQSMLSSPEPNFPQDEIVSRQILENREIFDKTARFWAQEYAGAKGPKDPDFETKIEALNNKGINREKAINSLSSNDWILNDVDFSK